MDYRMFWTVFWAVFWALVAFSLLVYIVVQLDIRVHLWQLDRALRSMLPQP